jgi:hypothetical protein
LIKTRERVGKLVLRVNAAITKEQMSDLPAFLRSAGAPPPAEKMKADEGFRAPGNNAKD